METTETTDIDIEAIRALLIKRWDGPGPRGYQDTSFADLPGAPSHFSRDLVAWREQMIPKLRPLVDEGMIRIVCNITNDSCYCAEEGDTVAIKPHDEAEEWVKGRNYCPVCEEDVHFSDWEVSYPYIALTHTWIEQYIAAKQKRLEALRLERIERLWVDTGTEAQIHLGALSASAYREGETKQGIPSAIWTDVFGGIHGANNFEAAKELARLHTIDTLESWLKMLRGVE